MDTCKIRPGLYQFTAIDDCGRFLVASLARRRSAHATLRFLDQVLEEKPFTIQRLQTDRGPSFLLEGVQRRLMDKAIRFRPIPPRSPHLNGKVERAQRTTLEEFWAATDPKAADVGDQLALWVHHYNWHRSHESYTAIRPSIGCLSGPIKQPWGLLSAMPMTLSKSTFRSVSTPLRWRYER